MLAIVKFLLFEWELVYQSAPEMALSLAIAMGWALVITSVIVLVALLVTTGLSVGEVEGDELISTDCGDAVGD
jgi:hypothetical protein